MQNVCPTLFNPALTQTLTSDLVSVKRFEPKLRLDCDFLPLLQSTNQDVYNGTVKDLVTGVLHGINTTVFAYGSTGSGKTYTMVGE